MIRFQIRLDEAAFKVLRGLAEREYRDPRVQAALLIRESLQKRGLLLSPKTAVTSELEPFPMDKSRG